MKLSTLLILLLLRFCKFAWCQDNCGTTSGGITFDIDVSVVMPTETYIYECQNSTLYLSQANVTFTGVGSDGSSQVVDAFVTGVGAELDTPTVTPTPPGAVTFGFTENTCANLDAASMTTANCQFVLQVVVTPTDQVDYEALAANNFEYSVRVRFFSTACGGWEVFRNVTVYVKDCNEFPEFDASIVSTSYLSEYSDGTGTFAGSIVNLLITDPDTENNVFGNVTISIASVYRPNLANRGVDPTPFWIEGYNFLHTNSNNTILSYDVSRCTVVSTCLEIFDSYFDTGNSAPSVMEVVLVATDGGGHQITHTHTISIIEVAYSPVFLNVPTTVSVAEDLSVATTLQIYPMQMIIKRSPALAGWSIMVITVNPSLGGAVTNGTACNPLPPDPVLCAPLTLTNLIAGSSFDVNTQYNVTIWGIHTAAPAGLVAQTVSSSILIDVIPMNKQPILTPNKTTDTVFEDDPIQQCLFDVSITPTDPNNDTVFYYEMVGISNPSAVTGSNDMWYLNGSQICYNGLYGSVGTCCNRVFRDTYSPYTILVQVRDAYLTPLPLSTFEFEVHVIKVDDPPIIYGPSTIFVNETDTNFQFDVNATQNYPSTSTLDLVWGVTSLSSMYNNASFYLLDNNSTRFEGYATVSVLGPGPYYFDFLTYPIIYLNVSVTDNILTTYKTIIIFVIYINRVPQVLNLPNSTDLLETTTGYAAIWTVSTSDKESDPRTFQFFTDTGMSQRDSSTFFSIDYNRGIIYYTNPSFDWFVNSSFTLPVLVQDNPASLPTKNASALANFTVNLILVNRAPEFTDPLAGHNQVNLNVAFYENVTGQSFFFTFNATDRESDSIYYNISSITPEWNTAFNIPWGSNQIEYNQYYTSSDPMFNSTIIPIYWISVYVTDNGMTPTSTATLTVHILYVPRKPVWTSLPANIEIREDVYYGPTEFYTIGAVDPNNKQAPLNVTFIGITPSSGNAKFDFNQTLGTIYYVQDPGFSFGIQNSYTAIFSTTNGVGGISSSSLGITIIKVNTGPWQNESKYAYNTTLFEDVTIGRLLWDLRVVSNQSLSLSYKLKSVSPQTRAFTVTNNGLLNLQDNPGFNYQDVDVYEVIALAFDTGLGSGQQAQSATFTLSVSLIPVAKQPIITNLPNFVTFREGSPGAGNIYTADCTDPAGDPLTWSHQVLPPSYSSYFDVYSNGSIATTTSASFTYWMQPKYLVVVYCTNGNLTATGTLTVAIIWTTTTSTTSTTTQAAVTTQTTTASSSGLTTGQIAAIAGSIGGLLLLAGLAFGIAQLLQKKATADGITARMKRPVQPINEVYLPRRYR